MKVEGYDFLTEQVTSIAPGAVLNDITVRDNEVTVQLGNVDVLVDDVIHLKYKDGVIPKGVYGICIYENLSDPIPSFSFKFDTEIFDLSSDIDPQYFYGIDVYRGTVYDKVSQYDIQTEIIRSTYSEELKVYQYSENHLLRINQEKRKFFGGFRSVLSADKILFADYCKQVAYGVSLSEDTYSNINNAFSKSINFNIAKR
jgi:hypothetical protein